MNMKMNSSTVRGDGLADSLLFEGGRSNSDNLLAKHDMDVAQSKLQSSHLATDHREIQNLIQLTVCVCAQARHM